MSNVLLVILLTLPSVLLVNPLTPSYQMLVVTASCVISEHASSVKEKNRRIVRFVSLVPKGG
jgi:hypothetical protein